MRPLNSPLELGLRTLISLKAAFPRSLDVDRLVLMDYCLLHSADLGGPPSVLPPVPARGGEIGIKRTLIEHGVQLMVRAEMIDVLTTKGGITYRAGEKAAPFLALLESPLVSMLGEIAEWAVTEFGDLSADGVRERIGQVTSLWANRSDDFVQASDQPAFDPVGEDDSL